MSITDLPHDDVTAAGGGTATEVDPRVGGWPAGPPQQSPSGGPSPGRGGPPGGGPPATPGPAPRPASRPSRWRRPSRAGWITAAIGALTALLYTWDLSRIGYANDYYAAAVKSATVSWKALFFGSIDPGNFITVDKPPAALWLQGLSGRLLGFSSWSMLAPEALAGVASVLILHHLVRRWAGNTAAHLAALAFALTPVAVLMFRYNNPDALLTLLCLGAAWALWSALETGRTRALVLSAVLVGFAFNTKMLQAFLVLPAFVLVYLFAGPPRLGRRIAQLAMAGVALVVSAGWWVAIVALWPASARPYIGSTSNNSILSLVFGYNGLGRIFGESRGGGGAGAAGGPGGGGNVGFGGAAGWLRLFNEALGGQVSWLLPLAGAGLVAGLWLTRRAPRTDRVRAGWLLWGGWALVAALVFSRAQGIFHPYYTVQLAPAVAALAGAGGPALWRVGRRVSWLSWLLPAAIIATGTWAVVLLNRTPDYHPWLRPTVLIASLASAVGIWVASLLHRRAWVVASATLAGVALLAGPLAYSLTTVGSSAGGSIVAAGPSSGGLGGAGFGGAGFGGGFGGAAGSGGARTTADQALIDYLEANRGDATYLVAAFGSQSSAGIIIASGQPVITIGGFNGGDPAPTLAQFQALVAEGRVRYVLVGGGGGFGGGPGGGNSELTAWITAKGTQVPASAYGGATTGATLYDLAGAA